MKQCWKPVALFYFLACLWSWPFFWWRDIHPESWKALEWHPFLKSWLIMWGPGISAIVCLFVFKNHQRTVTLKGTSLTRGMVFYYVIPISFAIWNRDASFLLLGLLGFISILGEELGWRGFLQDALKIKSTFFKALIIGIMWELWHFTNRIANKEPLQALKQVLIWVIITTSLSYLAIHLTNRTKSLFVAVTIHTAVNAGLEFENGWRAILTCLPIWIVLIWKWPVQNGVLGKNHD